ACACSAASSAIRPPINVGPSKRRSSLDGVIAVRSMHAALESPHQIHMQQQEKTAALGKHERLRLLFVRRVPNACPPPKKFHREEWRKGDGIFGGSFFKTILLSSPPPCEKKSGEADGG